MPLHLQDFLYRPEDLQRTVCSCFTEFEVMGAWLPCITSNTYLKEASWAIPTAMILTLVVLVL